MNEPVLGIDLGTTNSAVAVDDGGGVRLLADDKGQSLIPSVVSFHPSGDILVGGPARERRLLDAPNTVYSVKRLIGRPFRSEEVRRAIERFPFELREGPTGGVLVSARGEDYALSEISAFVLRQVRAQAEQALGSACSRAVVTVPANFNELQRSATKAAGRVAGLDVLRILNEPTAAALAYGYGRGSRERIAVFDLGGGTFDLTILELAGEVFEVLATAGDTYLGGDDIDSLIAEQMADAFLEHHRYDPREDSQAFERLRVAAEWAKCQLSERDEVQVQVEELAYGEGGQSLDLAFGLSRQALERITQPLIARAFDVCEDAMRVAAMRPTQLDNVILVGGATRMPLVERMVTEYFGRRPLDEIDPDLVVARGAAIQARALAAPAPEQQRKVARIPLKRMSAAELDAAQFARAQGDSSPVSSEESPGVQGSSWPPDGAAAGPAGGQPPPIPDEAKRGAGPPPPPPRPRTPTLEGVAPPPGAQSRGTGPEPPGEGPPPLPEPPAPQAPPPPPDVQSGEPPQAEPPSAAQPPLLLDVTPLSLGVETVSGYCEHIIQRNAAIPVEQTRTFSTARDRQEVVRVQICQGESRRLDENQPLGEIELSGLRSAPRGQVHIGVTFIIGADGILAVRAQDLETLQEQSIRINLIGGMQEEEIERMQQRHASLFSEQATGPHG